MRTLAVFALAIPMFAACAAPAEESAASHDDEVVSEALPFAVTTYGYRFDAASLAAKGEGCEATFYLLERAGDVTAKGRTSAPLDASTHFEGTIALPRSRRAFSGSLMMRCKSGYASATLEFDGIAEPREGADQILTAKIGKVESTVDLLTRDTPVRLALHTEKIGAAPKVAATNCKEEKGPKLFVRVRTSVWKDMPWTPPYGNDWKGKITLDGKLTHDFRPRLDKPGEVILAICSASERVHVKVDVKEDDLFVDDKYHPAEGDLTRGALETFRQSSTQQVEGPGGGNRAIETQVEVQ